MLIQIATLFLFIVAVLAILAVYAYKVGLHLQLIQIEKHMEPGRIMDIVFFDFKNADERKLRVEAFLRYPLMFPVVIEEDDNDEVVQLKKKIKNSNYGLYLLLIALIILNAMNA
ncbi:MAG: hypothetical protein EP346_11480 [Bacteroidetes bacterium]|uniref:Uncharacterized protein n=1 Tax=Phaeocystidibacter marisrubri TaxID=1577780 RepID=A0A6L3ZHE4_9FLAO|nr:hypothetical protein [Phaeocystidibacter marisrubri]KAB2817274.1 hypothetical protein F8C82_02465 [Phaeocystidibacter marisrubri]TNE27734.1 MAG: hypothetical protein EP346_11480 [Bacteroidota bacterium]GGH76142.1 hypothetical protein GCM10011318_23960 [Phaeocystidibacter marisrubri]